MSCTTGFHLYNYEMSAEDIVATVSSKLKYWYALAECHCFLIVQAFQFCFFWHRLHVLMGTIPWTERSRLNTGDQLLHPEY